MSTIQHEVVVRLDLDIVLRIDNFEPDTGEYFVKVGVWDDNDSGNGDYVYLDHCNMCDIVAAVSGMELEAFVASGVIPVAVVLLIDRFDE